MAADNDDGVLVCSGPKNRPGLPEGGFHHSCLGFFMHHVLILIQSVLLPGLFGGRLHFTRCFHVHAPTLPRVHKVANESQASD